MANNEKPAKKPAASELPPSPFSPALEGFQVLLLAGAAGTSGARILEALDKDPEN